MCLKTLSLLFMGASVIVGCSQATWREQGAVPVTNNPTYTHEHVKKNANYPWLYELLQDNGIACETQPPHSPSVR